MPFFEKKTLPFFIFIFLFVGLIINSCFAQQHKIDSLELLLSSSVHDTVHLAVLQELYLQYRNADYQKAGEITQQIIALSQALNNVKAEALGYINLSIVYYNKGFTTDSIVKMLDKAHDIAKNTRDRLLEAKVLSNKAIIYHEKGLDDKSLDLYNKALKITEESGKQKLKAKILNNMATVYHTRENSDMALIFLQKALKIAEELEMNSLIPKLYVNIGKIYSDNNIADTALVFFKKALEVKTAIKDEYFTVIILGEMGLAHLIKKEYEKGKELISKSHELAKELDDMHSYGYTIYLLANYANQLGNDEETIKYSLEGLKILESEDQISPLIAYYGYLKNAYSNLGNYQQAFEAQKNYYILKDSMYNIDREEHINNILVKYETQQKEAENKLLSVTISKQKNQQYLLIALLLASLGFLTTFISFIKIRQVKKIEQMRMDIAQDLHDEVGSKLTLIQIYVNKLLGFSDTKSRKEMVETGDEIYKVIKETHFSISDLVWSISPKTNTMKDLVGRLNDYSDDLLGTAEIPFQFDYSSIKFDEKLNPNFRQNILLIFKEALNNIIKHTHSSMVNINLINADNSFNMEITNEFDEKNANVFSGGNGLQNMKHRAKKIGGQIKVDEQGNQFKVCFSTKISAL